METRTEKNGSAGGHSCGTGGRWGRSRALPAVFSLALFAAACGQENVPAPYRPTRAHDAYTHSLVEAGLAHTALGREWITASQRALEESLDVQLPFREALYVDPAQVFAVGYRFESARGRRVEILVECQAEEPLRLFIDLFRTSGEEGIEHVASGSLLDRELAFEPRGEAHYVVRVQSELLRSGRIQISILDRPALTFPVLGYSNATILSRFGDARDGGRREHHGVDIFAPRHTPVVAASRGRVTRVSESRLGGRVVWIRDLERSLHHYYAHLETQKVEAGETVEPGRLIGTVGNSGNARTTKPHLHFGLYARGVGPLDPWEYLFDDGRHAAEPSVRLDLVGNWARIADSGVSLRQGPLPAAPVVQTLARATPVRLEGAVGRSYRAKLPDGTMGFVAGTAVEPLNHSLALVDREVAVLDRPSPAGLEMARIAAGSKLPVLGNFKGFVLVSPQEGRLGWASQTAHSDLAPADQD